MACKGYDENLENYFALERGGIVHAFPRELPDRGRHTWDIVCIPASRISVQISQANNLSAYLFIRTVA